MVITSPVRFLPEEIERSVLFSGSAAARPGGTGGVPARGDAPSSPGRSRRETCCTSLRARCRGSRSTKPATRCAAPWPAAARWDPNPLPALLEEKRLLVNRSGRDRIHFRAAPAWTKSAAWRA